MQWQINGVIAQNKYNGWRISRERRIFQKGVEPVLIKIQKIRTNVLGWFRRLDTLVIFLRISFWAGILMIGYDWLGHLSCLACRLTGKTGAYIWNTYSKYIYPSFPDELEYDLHWSIFFGIAICLLIIGRKNITDLRISGLQK